MSPVELEPTIPASELTQTYALDRAATGIDLPYFSPLKNLVKTTNMKLFNVHFSSASCYFLS
jgi:hypothetical protein